MGNRAVSCMQVTGGRWPAKRLVGRRTSNHRVCEESNCHDVVKVAEVMIEHPGSFVCPSSYILNNTKNKFGSTNNPNPKGSVMKRFHALPADHPLQHGQLYFVLPNHLLNKPASPHLLALLSHMASSSSKSRPSSGQRTSLVLVSNLPLPTSTTLSSSCNSSMNDQESLPRSFSSASSLPWKPNLHTIKEQSTPSQTITRMLSRKASLK